MRMRIDQLAISPEYVAVNHSSGNDNAGRVNTDACAYPIPRYYEIRGTEREVMHHIFIIYFSNAKYCIVRLLTVIFSLDE